MAFWTIEITPGLSDSEVHAAILDGTNRTMPQKVPTPEMLEEVGFRCITVRDVTEGYLRVAADWLDTARRLEEPLRLALGDALYEDRIELRQSGFDVTCRGLRRRMFYVADPQ